MYTLQIVAISLLCSSNVFWHLTVHLKHLNQKCFLFLRCLWHEIVRSLQLTYTWYVGFIMNFDGNLFLQDTHTHKLRKLLFLWEKKIKECFGGVLRCRIFYRNFAFYFSKFNKITKTQLRLTIEWANRASRANFRFIFFFSLFVSY